MNTMMRIIKELGLEILRWASVVLIWMPGYAGIFLRYFFYRPFFHRCGSKVCLTHGCCIKGFRNISFGNDITLGPNAQIYADGVGSSITFGDQVGLNSNVMINADLGGTIKIGRYTIIGPNVVFRAANHQFNRRDLPIRQQAHEPGIIVVEEDVWIGANAVILPNVTIHKGAVIGAGAVVTKDVPEYTVVAGVPAQTIGKR